MSATRAAEARAEAHHENEREPPNIAEDSIDKQEENEKLYMEVLQTIANTVGAPAPGGQVRKYTETNTHLKSRIYRNINLLLFAI